MADAVLLYVFNIERPSLGKGIQNKLDVSIKAFHIEQNYKSIRNIWIVVQCSRSGRPAVVCRRPAGLTTSGLLTDWPYNSNRTAVHRRRTSAVQGPFVHSDGGSMSSLYP